MSPRHLEDPTGIRERATEVNLLLLGRLALIAAAVTAVWAVSAGDDGAAGEAFIGAAVVLAVGWPYLLLPVGALRTAKRDGDRVRVGTVLGARTLTVTAATVRRWYLPNRKGGEVSWYVLTTPRGTPGSRILFLVGDSPVPGTEPHHAARVLTGSARVRRTRGDLASLGAIVVAALIAVGFLVAVVALVGA